MDEIQIVNVADTDVYCDELVTSRRVFGKENGVESVAVRVTTVEAGLEASDVVYPDNDEIALFLSGSAEVTYNGTSRLLGKGQAMFVPRGQSYDFKVVEGPIEMFVVFSPANS